MHIRRKRLLSGGRVVTVLPRYRGADVFYSVYGMGSVPLADFDREADAEAYIRRCQGG